jgi:hypothetical protein
MCSLLAGHRLQGLDNERTLVVVVVIVHPAGGPLPLLGVPWRRGGRCFFDVILLIVVFLFVFFFFFIFVGGSCAAAASR